MKDKISNIKNVYHYENCRVNSLNNGSVPNTGYRPLYTIMSHFAAFGPIIDCLTASGPWPYYITVSRFAAHFRYLLSIRNLVNLPELGLIIWYQLSYY